MSSVDGPTPGWYHAAGDPDGSVRYWNGATWVGEPQPDSQQPAQASHATMHAQAAPAPQAVAQPHPLAQPHAVTPPDAAARTAPATAGGYDLIAPAERTTSDPGDAYFSVGPRTDPQPVPYPPAYPEPAARRRPRRWDSSITWITIGTTLMRAAPFLIIAVVLDEMDFFSGTGVGADADSQRTVLIVGAIFAAPLVLQLVGVFLRSRGILLLGAIPILLLDLAIVVSTLLAGGIPVLMVIMAAAQGTVVFRATSTH